MLPGASFETQTVSAPQDEGEEVGKADRDGRNTCGHDVAREPSPHPDRVFPIWAFLVLKSETSDLSAGEGGERSEPGEGQSSSTAPLPTCFAGHPLPQRGEGKKVHHDR